MIRASALVGLIALLAPHTVAAQSLAERISAVRDGQVLFEFASRPEICGDGERSIRVGQHSYMGEIRSVQQPCVHGPVQVRLTLQGSGVARVESWVGGPREREGRPLGTVPAGEAARYLLALAARATGAVAAKAVAPAVFADSVVVWPSLLAIARDSSPQRRSAHNDAAFWLSRFASAAIAGHPTSLDDGDDDPSERDEVKVQAVFALSQLPHGEGIPPLLDVARSNATLAVRRSALFWLGQSGDPRALALFESLLRG